MRLAGCWSSVSATPASSRSRTATFAGTLHDSIGDWLAAAPDLPVLAAGMIGSRQGWLEVPYVPCPAGLPELAAGLVAVPAEGGCAVRLVPGLIRPGATDGFPDVMRGEETQILGDLAASHDAGQRCYVLPGHPQQVGLVRGWPDRALRHLHDRRGLRCPGPPQHPRPADGAGRTRRRTPSPRGSRTPPARPAPPRANCCTICSAPAPWD